MREPGIYHNINIELYHSEEGISSSGISLILDCPKRYWYEYMQKPTLSPIAAKKQSDKFKTGRALHMLILEPEKFEKAFYSMTEEVNLTTKIGKEKYAEAEFLAEEREIIRAADWFDIWNMAQSVKSHPLWHNLQDGKVEQSIYWDSGTFNTRLKTRPDIFNENMIIDVKTTDSIKGFQNSIHQYGYHRQAAMQIDGLTNVDGKIRHHGFFVIEKKAPYLTACFTLDIGSIEQGRREYLDAAAIYSECCNTGNWPGYESKFQTISVPEWAMKKESIL